MGGASRAAVNRCRGRHHPSPWRANDHPFRLLNEIARIHATGAGTAETSYYGALLEALNAAGGALRPKVFCIPQLASKRKAGHLVTQHYEKGGVNESRELCAQP
jgi:hypothetical protein